MEYFVSAEDTSYHHWQLELLIESFKLQGLQDKLVIGIAENNEQKSIDFSSNLKDFKRIFLHDNIGQKRGYLPINRPYSLLIAVSEGLIKPPFALIDPDMILVNPIPDPTENIQFQLKPTFTCNFADQNHCPVKKYIKELLNAKNIKDEIDYWIPLGNVIVFKDVPKEFFTRAVEWSEILEYERKQSTDKDWWFTERVAWIMTLLEFNGTLTYNGRYDLEMSLIDNNKINHFIHYSQGLPPVFNKLMYRFQPPFNFAMGDLFSTLLENNPTTSTNYLQHVVRSYLNAKPQTQTPLPITEFKIQYVTVKK